MLLEIFTHSLCSKPPPQSLDILWCKVVFFKTWISVVFSTVFLKKLKTINFPFFPHSWSLKCRTFFRIAPALPVAASVFFLKKYYLAAISQPCYDVFIIFSSRHIVLCIKSRTRLFINLS